MREVVFRNLLLPILAFASGVTSLATDYRAKEKQATLADNQYYANFTAQLAIGFGRASKALSHEDAEAIIASIQNKKPIPQHLGNAWQKLLRMAQTQKLLEAQRNFFPVGYEFETIWPDHYAYDDFQKGAEKYEKLLNGAFVVKGSRITDSEDTQSAFFSDQAGNRWSLTKETVRLNDGMDGFELGSPPFFKPERLQLLQPFMWRLGESNVGQSNQMTGGHQTYSIVPVGKKTPSPEVLGRMVANIMLMQSQFGPGFEELLDVKRMGGLPENFFFRPLVFDHPEFLKWLQTTDPKKLTLEAIEKRLRTFHLEDEFEAQIKNQVKMENITEAEANEMRKWSKEKKATWRKTYKYRDVQLKFNRERPEKSLVEIRIGDYVADRPEQAIRQTLIYQKLFNKALEMAEKGEVFKTSIPYRAPGESEKVYWGRLQEHQKSNSDELLKTIGIEHEGEKKLVKGEGFEVWRPYMEAAPGKSFAFEMEGWGEGIVKAIIPRDPKLRRRWSDLSDKKRIEALKEMGFEFGEYHDKNLQILTTEFLGDIDKYPFLSPELALESSGNWEVKSDGRDLDSHKKLLVAMNRLGRAFGSDEFALHVHQFSSQEKVIESLLRIIEKRKGPATVNLVKTKLKEKTKPIDLKTFRQAVEAVGLDSSLYVDPIIKHLEAQSLLMAAAGYNESSKRDAPHYLDSWSLDRFSEKDLAQIRSYLRGDAPLKPSWQKYHNIGFRPFPGALDVEFRDVGDQIHFGMDQISRWDALLDGDTSKSPTEAKKPLFFAFSEEKNKGKTYTLEHAVSEKYPLNAKEREFLRKLQFEVYKPSMSNYMFWGENGDLDSVEDVPNEKLDTKYVRANFENNVALPLLNYEEAGYVTKPEDRARLKKEKDAFVDRIHSLMKKKMADKNYNFLFEHDNFLHLADWLQRSTHPSRPNFELAPKSKTEKARQQKLLEELTYEARGEVVQFVKQFGLTQVAATKLPPADWKEKLKGCWYFE